jgi:hypothetical protein
MLASAAMTELARVMADNPGGVIETVAKEHDVTPRAVVEALPDSMRRFAPAETFVEAMTDVAKWGDVTLIIHTDDGIMEFGEFLARVVQILGDGIAQVQARGLRITPVESLKPFLVLTVKHAGKSGRYLLRAMGV